jgi:amino acid transporter
MTTPTPLRVSAVNVGAGHLKLQCLSYLEVFAQSVSVIAPSTVPAAVLGLIFASAGNGTWLSFLIGMLGLVLVSVNINQFARRSASAGSLYRFIVKGLGSTPGALGGWALLFGYLLTGMSTLCGFVVTAKGLLDASGVPAPSPVLSGLAILSIVLLASRDAQLSAKAMLIFEGAALAAVLALGVVVWRWHGFSIDTAQITLKGATPGGVLSGVVLVVFAFSGFESSTALGEEAKDPLRSIPRSVMQSVVVSGLIFIFMAYVVILGFRDLGEDLAKSESPLFFLSQKLGVGWLGAFINIGVLISFYSCTLASVSATARIIYSMARHRIAPGVLGAVHPRRSTPYVAVIFAALLTYVVALAPSCFGFRLTRIFRHTVQFRLPHGLCFRFYRGPAICAQVGRTDDQSRRRGCCGDDIHDGAVPRRHRCSRLGSVSAADLSEQPAHMVLSRLHGGRRRVAALLAKNPS